MCGPVITGRNKKEKSDFSKIKLIFLGVRSF